MGSSFENLEVSLVPRLLRGNEKEKSNREHIQLRANS